MKITLYTLKGGAGKTPLSMLFALDKEFAVGTNESYDMYSDFMPQERLLFVQSDEEFPHIPDDIDVVFDLAGTMTKHDYSILSAIRQSDVVLIPIWNNIGSIRGGLKSISAVAGHNPNIIVIATKLSTKSRKKGQTWEESQDFMAVKNAVLTLEEDLGFIPKVLPLKFSEVFETLLRDYVSVHQLAAGSGLAAYTHRELLQQIDDINEEVARYDS